MDLITVFDKEWVGGLLRQAKARPLDRESQGWLGAQSKQANLGFADERGRGGEVGAGRRSVQNRSSQKTLTAYHF
jgi:hypothetical protein